MIRSNLERRPGPANEEGDTFLHRFGKQTLLRDSWLSTKMFATPRVICGSICASIAARADAVRFGGQAAPAEEAALHAALREKGLASGSAAGRGCGRSRPRVAIWSSGGGGRDS